MSILKEEADFVQSYDNVCWKVIFFSKVETLKNIWFEMPTILKFLIEGKYFHCLENPLQMPKKHFLVHQFNLNCFEHIVLWEILEILSGVLSGYILWRYFAKIFSHGVQGESRRNECAQSHATHREVN